MPPLSIHRSLSLPSAVFFAFAAHAWCAPTTAGTVFNIRDYGAHNDASAPSTEAFRAAIQAATAAGGGTVFVPAGRYESGPIELVSNLVLYFDAGAIVHFPAMRLPFTKGRQQSIKALTPVPLIGGHHLQNVTIGGRGLLTSDNAEWMKLMPRQKSSGGGTRERPASDAGAQSRFLERGRAADRE